MVTNPNATDRQKAAAVGKVAETAVGSAVKSTAKKVAKSGVSKKAQQKLTEIATNYGKSVPVIGLAITAAQAIAASGAHKKVRNVFDKTDAAIARVEEQLAKVGQKLTKQQRKTLYKQHLAFYRANPNAP